MKPPAVVAVTTDPAEMTYEERQALPAQFHVPHWMGLTTEPFWMCAVCWDEGLYTSWPCEPATKGGKALAESTGLGFSW